MIARDPPALLPFMQGVTSPSKGVTVDDNLVLSDKGTASSKNNFIAARNHTMDAPKISIWRIKPILS